MSSHTSSTSANTSSTSERDESWIPEGFRLVVGPDDTKYIVMDFIVPALEQDYHSNKKKEETETLKASGTVSPFHSFMASSTRHRHQVNWLLVHRHQCFGIGIRWTGFWFTGISASASASGLLAFGASALGVRVHRLRVYQNSYHIDANNTSKGLW
jgi:hypothetical protein